MLGAKRQPQDPEAWHAYGLSAFERGDLEEGRQALLQSTQLGPPVLERLMTVAQRLGETGFYSDAAAVLRRAAENFSDRPEPKLGLAWLFLEAGDANQSARVAVQALRMHPRNPELHIAAAAAHERLGALAEATNHLAAVLAADADHLDANRRLAPLLQALGDEAGAERCLRRIVELTEGRDLEAVVSLGIGLSSAGRHQEAIALLSGVAERSPRSAAIRADLGMAFLAAGDLDAGVSAFTAALQLDPRSAQAYCGLGLAYRQLERYQEAAEAFRATEQLAPDQATASFNLGLVLAAMGDDEGARKALLRAAALAPDDVEIRGVLQSFLAPGGGASGTEAPKPPVDFNASITGDLRSFLLPDVLEFLRLQSKTGSLVVSSRNGAGIVRLVRGQVTSASAPGVKRLGEALVERGIISRHGLESALARQRGDERESSEALGSVLFRDRPTEARVEITRVVFQQVLDALEQMLGWKEGAFSFHPEGEKEMPAIAFDVQNVMLELMRLADERNESGTSN
jgi:tetratricopeptide (TPR) repeat protein